MTSPGQNRPPRYHGARTGSMAGFRLEVNIPVSGSLSQEVQILTDWIGILCKGRKLKGDNERKRMVPSVVLYQAIRSKKGLQGCAFLAVRVVRADGGLMEGRGGVLVK